MKDCAPLKTKDLCYNTGPGRMFVDHVFVIMLTVYPTSFPHPCLAVLRWLLFIFKFFCSLTIPKKKEEKKALVIVNIQMLLFLCCSEFASAAALITLDGIRFPFSWGISFRAYKQRLIALLCLNQSPCVSVPSRPHLIYLPRSSHVTRTSQNEMFFGFR